MLWHRWITERSEKGLILRLETTPCSKMVRTGLWLDHCKISGSSANPTFCPKYKISFIAGLGEG